MSKQTIYLGADHRGFALKELISEWLSAEGYHVVDKGNTQHDPEDDFPVFSFAVAHAVADNPDSFGIVVCGSGVGVNIAANKVPGIRASTAVNPEEVEHARFHDDLNVLALSADYMSLEYSKICIEVFLQTPFSGKEKYQRRIDMITKYEQERA